MEKSTLKKIKVGDYIKINYNGYCPNNFFKIIYIGTSIIIDTSSDKKIGWIPSDSNYDKWGLDKKPIKAWSVLACHIIALKKANSLKLE